FSIYQDPAPEGGSTQELRSVLCQTTQPLFTSHFFPIGCGASAKRDAATRHA
ncbi:hypothetical protein SAMN05192539_10831, partial [Paraburkholderia diazotrophica]